MREDHPTAGIKRAVKQDFGHPLLSSVKEGPVIHLVEEGSSIVPLSVLQPGVTSMQDWLAVHEPEIRLGTFLSVLIAMMIWEVASPRRQPSQGRGGRLDHQPVDGRHQYRGLESRVPDPGGGHGGGCVGTELGVAACLGAPPMDIRAHRGTGARLFALWPARAVSFRVAALASPHDAPQRPRLRYDNRRAVSSNRNRHLDGYSR